MKISTEAKMQQQQEVMNDMLEDHRTTLKMTDDPSEKSCNRFERFSITVHQQLKTTMDCIRSPSTCANMNQVSSSDPFAELSANASPLQQMCTNIRAAQRGAIKSDAKAQADHTVNRFVKRSTASYTREGIFRPTFICLLIMMALNSRLHVTYATESASSQGSDSAKPNHGHDPNSNERVDLPASKSDSQPSSSAISPEKSIVASLSSAVATAAAAAAVAAAQNSLSTNDARSLASGSRQRQHAQAQRSPGLNLAIKLVDTIPEVPYNILHNMKKLDHAAPFYNVPNKITGSTTKESTQNFLANALAAGNFGGAAEQLSALFRSPLWKRISDGYGEFASEFRSRFRPPGAAPMKGPTSSSTSKILRDISVPALLMLLASSVSGTDWRPVRTRRKSFVPVDIPAALPSSGLASSPALLIGPNFKDSHYYQPEGGQQLRLNLDPMISEASANGKWIDQAAPNRLQPQQNQQADSALRLNAANVQTGALDASAANSWTSSQASGAVQSGAISSVGQDQNQQYYTYAPAMGSGSFAQLQPVKRSDEIIATDSGYPSNPPASSQAVESAPSQQRSSLFSSLTSDLALGQGKLVAKLLNANVASDGNAYRMMSLADSFNWVQPIKRDQLSDKQRYSLIEPSDGDLHGGANEQSPSTKPFSLSAITNAASSIINTHPSSVESGSFSRSAAAAAAGQQQSGKPGFFSRANFQHLIGDKTINHSDTFARRQPQQAGNFAEQRDLTKLLPESWREVVKRTMNTVQQQANVQWKSIEGQLTNWVQDKLKTVAAGGSSSPSASSSSSSSSSSSGPAPVANMLASMSSTALNILGLHKNTNSSTHSSADHPSSSTAKVDKSSTGPAGNDANSVNQRGKLEKNPSVDQQPAKGALAGVASVLVKSLTNRQSSSTATPSSPLSSPPKPSATDSTSMLTNDAPTQVQSLKVADTPVASSSSNSVASQYPTLTGAQPESQSPTKESGAATSVASSSQANVQNANN